MRALRIIVLCGLGLLAGWTAWQAMQAGYPQPWSKLPAPPAIPGELMWTDYVPVSIRTVDGDVYTFSDGKGWVSAEPRPEQSGPPTDVEPCTPVFLRLRLPNVWPNTVRQCTHITEYYADGFIEYGVALDSEGNVWKWQRARTPAELPVYVLSILCCPSVGGLLGLGLATLWNGNAARSRKDE